MDYLCFDIGGTSIKYALFNQLGEKLTQTFQMATLKTENDNKILEIVHSIIEEYSEKIQGVCISTAGVVGESGEIAYAGYTIPGYKGTQLKASIEDKFNIPCEVENDVNCACLGEVWKGEGKNINSAVMLTLGTGIGGAIYINRQLWTGASFTAGELGYMLVNGKYFQDLASATALMQIYYEKTGNNVSAKNILELAKLHDTIALQSVQQQMFNLATGIVNILYLLNPEKIIIGGGIMAQSDFLMPILSNYIEKQIIDTRFAKKTEIVPALLGNEAGMLGALYNFLVKRDE